MTAHPHEPMSGWALHSESVFVSALPAADYGDEFPLTEHVDPRADVTQSFPSTGRARGSSQAFHISTKYRGVTP